MDRNPIIRLKSIGDLKKKYTHGIIIYGYHKRYGIMKNLLKGINKSTFEKMIKSA
jgi:hypothetical protein